MTIDFSSLPLYASPLLAIAAGIVILIKPKLLNYVVAYYLIITGVLGLLQYF